MREEEQFKDIPKFGGRYRISNMGRIWDVELDTEILPSLHSSTGYYNVSLYDETGVSQCYAVHRLLLHTWRPHEKPKNSKNYSFFKDKDKSNLKLSNIFWGHYKAFEKNQREANQSKQKKTLETIVWDPEKPIYHLQYGRLVGVYCNFQEAYEINNELDPTLSKAELAHIITHRILRKRNLYSPQDFTQSYIQAALKTKGRIDAIRKKRLKKIIESSNQHN